MEASTEVSKGEELEHREGVKIVTVLNWTRDKPALTRLDGVAVAPGIKSLSFKLFFFL